MVTYIKISMKLGLINKYKVVESLIPGSQFSASILPVTARLFPFLSVSSCLFQYIFFRLCFFLPVFLFFPVSSCFSTPGAH